MPIAPTLLLAFVFWTSMDSPKVDVPDRPAGVDNALAEVEPDRVKGVVETFVGFGTRHTLSDRTSETRGIAAAQAWAMGELEAIRERSGRADMIVELMRHVQPKTRRVPEETDLFNVVAILPGTMPEAKDRYHVVLGHLDSINGSMMDAEADAPGANDDASGCAAVLELARVLSTKGSEVSLVFLMTSGEEQGLLGAGFFADHAVKQGWRVDAVLNNDMIGDPSGRDGADLSGQVRVFSPSLPTELDEPTVRRLRRLASVNDSPSRQLARFIADVARRHETAVQPLLINRADRFLRGGDHTPFYQSGFAAVRFTEVFEKYDRQHVYVEERDGEPYGDVPTYVDADYLADVTRLNLATLMTLANAPSAPANARMIVARLENDTTLRWDASPEPDTAGYEVLIRPTIRHEWTEVLDVGPTLEATLPDSKDDCFFGVRAYDRDGHRSLVSFAGVGRE